MKTNWSLSNTHRMEFQGILEFRDNEGEWRDFTVVYNGDRLVFGGVCNIGFIESGYLIIEDGETIDEAMQELLSDLEVYYNDGPQYVSRIVCNERM